MDSRASLDGCIKSHPVLGFDLRTIHFIASWYIDSPRNRVLKKLRNPPKLVKDFLSVLRSVVEILGSCLTHFHSTNSVFFVLSCLLILLQNVRFPSRLC